MKLLIVEDEIQLADALTEILKRNMYNVDTVYDGIDGLDNALTGVYDGIILDIMLPRMNGIEILRQIRKEKISTPVLLLTARSEVEDKINGLELRKNTCSIIYGGNDVKLSLKEYHIMELLISNPRQILPKERIIEKIWGYESDVEYNNIEVYISFLRKKIAVISAPVQIKTARGIGYSLE